jgi:hypothetical protein
MLLLPPGISIYKSVKLFLGAAGLAHLQPFHRPWGRRTALWQLMSATHRGNSRAGSPKVPQELISLNQMEGLRRSHEAGGNT